ncbi:hypothetical protein C8R46DRAFT_863084, partial [Mycena filopes]
KHITKALQTRLQTSRAALGWYNLAAFALSPPIPPVTCDDVMDFTFLANFDILRDPEANALRLWATLAARQLMDTLQDSAKEEIIWLNVEIWCFVTYIRDEKKYLIQKEAEVALVDPHLPSFVKRYRWRRGRFHEGH